MSFHWTATRADPRAAENLALYAERQALARRTAVELKRLRWSSAELRDALDSLDEIQGQKRGVGVQR